MRTLASTFSTRDEAEAASRRLEAIGIGRERIILKNVSGTGADPDAVFVSVKVTTEQVQPASEILKGRGTREETAGSGFADPAQEPVGQAAVVSELPPSPPPSDADLATSPPRTGAHPQPQPARAPIAGQDRARLSRYVVFYGLALVAAFVIGAWLGMLD
jgi:hypothetical protein